MAVRFRLYLPDGVAAADTEGVEGETAADAAGGGRGGGRSFGVPDQADVDKVTWLHAYKYYTAMEYANFNPAEKAWIHQNRSEEKDKSPKRKVAVRFAGAMRTPWTRLTTTKVFLAMTMKAFRPRNPMPRTPRLPARERNSRTDRPWLTWI